MSKCEHWHKTTVQKYDPWRDLWLPSDLYRCWGTKEAEICSCGGDPTKCDFYPEKREEAKKPMYTAEMWLVAQQDGKTYRTGDMAYSAEKGLRDYYDDEPWPMNAFRNLSELMECEWEEVTTMKRHEAEAKLGIKIID